MPENDSPAPSAPSEQRLATDAELLVGGQALIEGVMMRSPGAYGVAVRRPDGSLALQRGKVVSLARRYPIFKLPVLRGIAVLFQSLALGIRALNFSAEQAIATAGGEGAAAGSGSSAGSTGSAGSEHPEASAGSAGSAVAAIAAGSTEVDTAGGKPAVAGPAKGAGEAGPDAAAGSGWAIAGSMVMGLGLGAVVFLLLPLWLTQLAERHLFGTLSGLGFNLLDGGLRALFFLAYLIAISRFREIHRVFMYHGAEHKVVFNYEARLPLTVANARAQSRLHPRCGTSFLLFVLLVSILVFSLIPKSAPFLVKFGGRLVLVPVIAGLSYEVLRLTARRRAAPLFAAMVFPGLMLQKITTQEPSDDMLEVAIVALEEALREDGLLPEAGAVDVAGTAPSSAGAGGQVTAPPGTALPPSVPAPEGLQPAAFQAGR